MCSYLPLSSTTPAHPSPPTPLAHPSHLSTPPPTHHPFTSHTPPTPHPHTIHPQVPFFAAVKSSVISRVVFCLKPEVYLAGDYVVRAGLRADALFFITRGDCLVLVAQPKSDKLRHGDHCTMQCTRSAPHNTPTR